MKRKVLAFVLILSMVFAAGSQAIADAAVDTPLNLPITGQTFSLGSRHSLAITEDGTLWAWGDNRYGQLGDGTTNNSSVPVKIMENIAAVSAGLWHSMAITNDGTLWGWGMGYFGRIGDGTMYERHSPVKIMENVTFVSASHNYSIAIKTDGTLWSWGWNGTGELGTGEVGGNQLTPVKILENVVAASTGISLRVAIKADGTMWGWGRNYGLILPSSSDSVTRPIEITFRGNLANTVWTNVSVGNASAIMHILPNGTLFSWGRTPMRSPFTNVAFISAGTSHYAAIRTDGSLYTWGRNSNGQIGDGTVTTYIVTHREIPGMPFPSLSFAIDENNNRTSPVKVMDSAVAVAVGWQHTMALKTDGSLWAWGNNSYGQLGDGTVTTYYPTFPDRPFMNYIIYENNNRSTPIHIMDNVKMPYNAVVPPLAHPSTQSLLLNGEPVAFNAYNINWSNYFRLRDLAYALNGTAAQFSVGWDEQNNAINLVRGEHYTPIGGEMVGRYNGIRTPLLTSSNVFVDGEAVTLNAFHIDGFNYFRLRDLGAALNFEVDWDEATNTIIINTH